MTTSGLFPTTSAAGAEHGADVARLFGDDDGEHVSDPLAAHGAPPDLILSLIGEEGEKTRGVLDRPPVLEFDREMLWRRDKPAQQPHRMAIVCAIAAHYGGDEAGTRRHVCGWRLIDAIN